jgi:hypothetical protein
VDRLAAIPQRCRNARDAIKLWWVLIAQWANRLARSDIAASRLLVPGRPAADRVPPRTDKGVAEYGRLSGCVLQ